MAATIPQTTSHRAGPVHQAPGLELRDHWFVVPLDHLAGRGGDAPTPSGGRPGGSDGGAVPSATITVFAREVVSVANKDKGLPWLLFLQGGPGFEAGRPTEGSGWLGHACLSYRVLLLDQRGTGLSTPLTAGALGRLGPPAAQAAYLAHFRADSIVCDAELVRAALLPKDATWTVLGQSYGGFCAVTYLSIAPHGLRAALLTGGLPPGVASGCAAEAAYRRCFERVAAQSRKFYARFPGDVKAVQDVVLHLADSGGVDLPCGGVLTPRGLQALGLAGLGQAGGFERLHYLLERAWEVPLVATGEDGAAPPQPRLSSTFLLLFERWLDFDTNPLYAVLHESIYCQGAASRWAAERVRAESPARWDAVEAARAGRPVPFTGEMIFPWMFEEWAALQPLKGAAELLASKEDWGPLYDKGALNANKVPVAAAIYYEDLYVSRELSEATAAEIAGARVFVTNEYMHSGIREDGPKLLGRLLGMLDGSIPLS